MRHGFAGRGWAVRIHAKTHAWTRTAPSYWTSPSGSGPRYRHAVRGWKDSCERGADEYVLCDCDTCDGEAQ